MQLAKSPVGVSVPQESWKMQGFIFPHVKRQDLYLWTVLLLTFSFQDSSLLLPAAGPRLQSSHDVFRVIQPEENEYPIESQQSRQYFRYWG